MAKYRGEGPKTSYIVQRCRIDGVFQGFVPTIYTQNANLSSPQGEKPDPARNGPPGPRRQETPIESAVLLAMEDLTSLRTQARSPHDDRPPKGAPRKTQVSEFKGLIVGFGERRKDGERGGEDSPGFPKRLPLSFRRTA
jgi:hypothetical protein